MKKVFVCSPFRGDIQINIIKAREFSRYVIMKGFLPICPHIYFTQFLDDSCPKERKLGMSMGQALMNECDEVWVFGNIVSDGMKQEIECAKSLFKKIKFIKKRVKR